MTVKIYSREAILEKIANNTLQNKAVISLCITRCLMH